MANSTIDPNALVQQDASLFTLIQDDLSSAVTFQGVAYIDSLTIPQGDITPIRLPDPANPGNFVTIRTTRAAPDLGEISIIEQPYSNRLSLGERMTNQLCDWALILKLGNCARKDILTDWKSLLLVTGAQASEFDYGSLGSFEENNRMEWTTTASVVDAERLFPVRLASEAESIVVAEVLDVIYADAVSCGTCAPYSSGCNTRFALTKTNSSSVGLSGQIVFTTNGTDFNTNDINSLSGANGTSLVAVGPYLVVTQQTATAQHHYALKASVTSAPTSQHWAAVTSGYQTGGGGRCATVGNSQRLFVGGAGGYVYGSDNVASSVTVIQDASITTQNFNAISYANGNLLVVGNSATILLSTNADDSLSNISFTSISAPSAISGVNITACYIRSATQFEIATANGRLYYTSDGGANWTQRGLPSTATGTISNINDLVYNPDFPLVGAMAVQTATRGYILRTYDGGRSWDIGAPSITQLATAPQQYNAVALCGVNLIFTGGLKASSTDGLLAQAS